VECRACPFECGVDRRVELGVCRAPEAIEIALAQLHQWEEPPISGTRGSGTVFFSHCNLRCRFCQNHDISQEGRGRRVTPERLEAIMLELEAAGAHNINLVTPTHYSDQLLPVVESAARRLRVPFVWNSNGYEKPATLARFEGLVAVWLPDFKYWDDAAAARCSSAPGYARHARAAIGEMFRQAGPFREDENGIARRGVIVRHLVLPGLADDSIRILEWLAAEFGHEIRVSLMAQYYPTHRAAELPGLDRRLRPDEYARVRDRFQELQLEGFAQELDSASRDYTPDFDGRGI
jgi:putative pyruvate formate lyase activating enzyme